MKYISWFAVFLLLHLVFWAFTGMTLWSPIEDGSMRGLMIIYMHLFVFAVAAYRIIMEADK